MRIGGPRPLWIWVLLAIGCGEDETRRLPSGGDADAGAGDVGEADAGPQPEMTIETLEVDFGGVPLDYMSERVITVRNTGDAPLRFHTEAVNPGFDPAFSFTAETATLAFGASRNVRVSFRPPDQTERTAAIAIVPEHEGLTPQQVELHGQGIMQCLTVDPLVVTIDFAIVGLTEVRPLRITNTCTGEQTIRIQYSASVRSSCPASFEQVFCLEALDPPYTREGELSLAGGQTAMLELQFTPNIPFETARGTVTISNCPLAGCAIAVPVSGMGF